MNKLKDLVRMAAASAELPKEVNIKGHDVELELLLVNEILNPVIHIVALHLYNKAFNGLLLDINGIVKKDEKKPFGLVIDGDIDESTAQMPLGILIGFYIEALKLIKPLIEGDLLEALSLSWSEKFFFEVKDGGKVLLKNYLNKPMLDVIYTLAS